MKKCSFYITTKDAGAVIAKKVDGYSEVKTDSKGNEIVVCYENKSSKHAKRWAATEKSTGLLICNAETRLSVSEKVNTYLDRITSCINRKENERFKDLIAEAYNRDCLSLSEVDCKGQKR